MNIQHDCSTELKQADLQVTPARIAALRLFESHDKPIDALSLVEELSGKGIDRVTAFRILNAFIGKKLLRKIELREGKARYELTNRGDHHHFVCSVCGDITDIGKETIMHDFIEKAEKKFNFQITDHSLEFFGTCASCLGKGNN